MLRLMGDTRQRARRSTPSPISRLATMQVWRWKPFTLFLFCTALAWAVMARRAQARLPTTQHLAVQILHVRR